MKPNWIVVLCGIAVVVVSFTFAFIEGANAGQENHASIISETIAN